MPQSPHLRAYCGLRPELAQRLDARLILVLDGLADNAAFGLDVSFSACSEWAYARLCKALDAGMSVEGLSLLAHANGAGVDKAIAAELLRRGGAR